MGGFTRCPCPNAQYAPPAVLSVARCEASATWCWPQKVGDATLWRATGGVGLRVLIEQFGDVRGIYEPTDPIARELVRRYAVGASLEIVGILTFYLSPVWVLAALGDVTRAGRTLVTKAGDALRTEGLIDSGARFRNMDQLLHGIEETSTHLALNINVPPLNIKGLRTEWEQFRTNLATLRPAKLPAARELRDTWNRIEDTSAKVGKSVFSVSAAMSLSALAAVPAQLQWLSRSAASAAGTTGSVVGGVFLDHYAAASREMSQGGLNRY